MSAPKLTKAQREALRLIGTSSARSLGGRRDNSVKSLERRGLIRVQYVSVMFGDVWEITDAGRAALKGEL